jgi:NAD(P)H dehydrogenase (quinone)
MTKLLICYYSRSGNTKKMAYLIAQGAREEDVEVDVKDVKQVDIKQLRDYDGMIFGSPTYYGGPAAAVKDLIDKSIRYHGKLQDRVGGAFSSSSNVGGGNETTVLALLQALLIHGMIVCGDSSGDHYGPVSIEAPDARVEKNCIQYGKRIAALTKMVRGQ